jgi:hypothetical protein
MKKGNLQLGRGCLFLVGCESGKAFLEQANHFAFFREACEFLFGKDQLAVQRDFKDTAAGRNQGELSYVCPEEVQDLIRQTDGTGQVVSHRAVGKGDVRFVHGRFLLYKECNYRSICGSSEQRGKVIE